MCKFTHRLLVFLLIGVQRFSWAAPTTLQHVEENVLPLLELWQGENNDQDEHTDERQFGRINVRFNFDDILVGIPYNSADDDEYVDLLWTAAAQATTKPTTEAETKLSEEIILERQPKPLSKHEKFKNQNRKSRIALKNLFDALLARYQVLTLDD